MAFFAFYDISPLDAPLGDFFGIGGIFRRKGFAAEIRFGCPKCPIAALQPCPPLFVIAYQVEPGRVRNSGLPVSRMVSAYARAVTFLL